MYVPTHNSGSSVWCSKQDQNHDTLNDFGSPLCYQVCSRSSLRYSCAGRSTERGRSNVCLILLKPTQLLIRVAVVFRLHARPLRTDSNGFSGSTFRVHGRVPSRPSTDRHRPLKYQYVGATRAILWGEMSAKMLYCAAACRPSCVAQDREC